MDMEGEEYGSLFFKQVLNISKFSWNIISNFPIKRDICTKVKIYTQIMAKLTWNQGNLLHSKSDFIFHSFVIL